MANPNEDNQWEPFAKLLGNRRGENMAEETHAANGTNGNASEDGESTD